ncbi:MAG: LysR substrate-binding domain-containing protein [Aliidongia sp.]
MRLLHRTTRSVSPTDAGLRLLERLRPAIEQIDGALEDLNDERQRPFGRLRIYAGHLGAAAVIAPIWGRFLSTYPDVHLELRVDETPADIVAMGFDAGIASQDRAAADMIAVRVMGPMKVAVVGAPAYFARKRPPRTPDDLARHSCVQYRMAADGAVREWSFNRNGRVQNLPVEGRVIVNYADMALRAAVDGLGIAYTLEAMAELFLRSGQLIRVLEGLLPIRRGTLPLLSRPPASPGGTTRPHRHDPRDPRLGQGRSIAQESLYRLAVAAVPIRAEYISVFEGKTLTKQSEQGRPVALGGKSIEGGDIRDRETVARAGIGLDQMVDPGFAQSPF